MVGLSLESVSSYFQSTIMVTQSDLLPNRPLLLARNLGMAREYGVLDRVFYGSDYVGENIDEYMNLLA